MVPGVLAMGLSTLLSSLLLDSPQYHFDKGDKDEAARLFKKIGRANGIKLKVHRDLVFEERIQDESEWKSYDTMEPPDQDQISNGGSEGGLKRPRKEVIFET
mmetsp:Transcript_31670/g.30967  ORF Transcript_31670/g.30967 Transcript_31670/m.30967 type:complete len:102 (+) Transcript_31670:825-1130(+)